MAFASCTLSGFTTTVPGSLMKMSPKLKQALKVFYKYRQQNPSTVGQTIPAATLLSQSKCLECAPTDDQLDGYEVWISRQAAIDAGAAFGAFSASGVMAELKCLTCLSMHELKAIELLLNCQLS